MSRLIKKYPVTAFIVLTMLWSWSIWSFLFLFIGPGGLLHNPPAQTYIIALLGGLGPSLVGILLTKIIYGKEGMHSLWQRTKHWNVGYWWLAILIVPTITVLIPLLRLLLGQQVHFSEIPSLLLPGISIGIIAGLMEEFGWRGFLLPQLLKRYSPLKASVIIGLIWGGLWHGYADYFGLGDAGTYFFPIVLLLGPGILIAWSLLLTWVYKHTNGSLLLSIFMHASISSSAFILTQKYASRFEELVWTAINVSIALVLNLVIVLNDRRFNEAKK